MIPFLASNKAPPKLTLVPRYAEPANVERDANQETGFNVPLEL